MTRMQELNPYKDACKAMAVHSKYGAQVNTKVSRADYVHLTTVSPEWGTVQTVVGTLFKSVVDALHRNNIHEYNPTAVLNVVIAMRRRALEVTLEEGPFGNESRRTSGVCQGTPDPPVQRTSTNGCPEQGQ